MKQPIYITCDTCQCQFPVKVYHKTVHLFPRVWKMYLKCPQCKTVYTSGYFDEEVQSMIDLGASKEYILKKQKLLEEQYGSKIHLQN